MAERSPGQSIELLNSDSAWDAYVCSRSVGSFYQTTAWRNSITKAFGKTAYFLQSVDEQKCINGVLPLIHIRSRLLGSRLVSMPYANYGGVLADSPDVANALRMRAIELGAELGVGSVELRETAETLPTASMVCSSEKVIMRLTLPETMEEVGQIIGAKRRSQVKRPLREGACVHTGGIDLLGPFYEVFSRNMRDLGTPVYPKRFFKVILEQCADNAQIVLITVGGEAAAAGFLMRWKDSMEIPWASSNRKFNPISVNMLLYWEAIRLAVEQGCTRFDFGRTTPGSGTWKFKKQWGAEPLECHWRLSPNVENVGGNNGFQQVASRFWQKLPVPLANWIGPRISPDLPW